MRKTYIPRNQVKQIQEKLDAALSAIDFLTMVAGTDATGDNTTASDATTTADSNSTATK
jgi:hypothetical protein